MKKFLLLFIVCSTIVVQAISQCAAPVINSFAPNTGYIGSTVTITGANFDANPANNQVFFGATQATVLTASFGVLTVTVPTGATYAPISVRNNCGLIGTSTLSFNGIFCQTPLTNTTFNTVTYTASVSGGYQMLSQDMDLDGKPDLLVCGFTTNRISIMRNLSTAGTFNFAPKFDLAFSGATRCIVPADFDGDGKPDLAVVDNGVNGLVIFRNRSTSGNLSFDNPIYISNIGGYQAAAGDLNNDGKLDLAVTGNNNNIVTLRNTSSNGTISFAVNTSPNNLGYATGLVIADIDNDGIKDIGTTCGGNNFATAIRNTTAPGSSTFTFDAVKSFSTGGSYPYRLVVADFDKDGKIDFATCNFSSGSTGVLRNTSSVGNVNFASALVLASPSSNYRISVGDADGDGLTDIVTKSSGENLFSVYRNTTTPGGNISFANKNDYPGQAEVSGVVIADFDGDFVPDIATSGTSYNTLRLHKNTSSVIDNTPPTASCKNITVALSPAGTATVTAAMIDNGSSDACGIGTIKINDADQVTFTCQNIGANNVTLKVTDRAGNVSTCNAVVTVAPAAIIVAGQSTVCQGQTVTLNANQGDSYQWYNNGTAINGANAQTYTASVSGNYTVQVTNAGGCSGTSSAVAVTVNENPTVDITPSGVASLCPPNNSTVLSASTSSIYQWKKDGNNIANATQQALTVTAAGSYSVQVIDLFGCSATSSPVVVSATDNVAPTARVKNLTLAMNAAKSLSITASDINDNSFDNCGGVTIALQGQNTFTCVDVNRTIDVTLVVTDSKGNVSNAIAKITITDPNKYCNQAPVAKAKALTLNAGNNCNATADASAFNDGSSDPDGDEITMSISPSAPYALGTTNVVFTVTDSKGESTSVNTTVTVVDVTAPTVSNPGTLNANNTLNKCSGTVVVPAFTVTENCAGGTVSNTETFEEYATGNVNNKSALWQLWQGGTSALVSTEKAWNGTKSLKVTGVPAGGPVDQLYLLGNQTSGKWVATFKMYIPAGRTGYYNLQHDETPGISWAHQVAFRSNGTGFVNAVGQRFNFTYPNDSWFEVKQIIDQDNDLTTLYINNVAIQTWKFSLNNNNQQAQNKIGGFDFFPANWEGDPNPAATPLYYIDDIKFEGEAAMIGALTARRYSTEYPVGTTTVNAVIADAAGNQTTSTFNVVITDTQKPTITARPDITVNSEAGKCGANVTIPGPAVSDNCGIRNVTVSKAGFFDVGTTTITWTVTDVNGNTATATQNITVLDKEAPSITAPASKSVTIDAGVCGATVALGTPVTGDNCGVDNVKNNAPAVFPVGTTTVTWTVTDIHGNSNTATQSVTVADNEAPKVVTQNVSVTLVNGAASITAQQIDNGSSDNCAIASMSISRSSFSCADLGSNTVTLTVTDIHGNTANKTATVTVVGTIPAVTVGVSRTDNTFTGLDANVVSLGYGAQTLNLTASNSVAGSSTTYVWTASSGLTNANGAGAVFAPIAAGNYTYTVTGTNQYGCSSTGMVKLSVVDVRCGNNGDKVQVCQVPPGNKSNPQSICIAPSAVAAHLAKGSYLGACRVNNTRISAPETTQAVVTKDELYNDGTQKVVVYPVPTSGIFDARIYNMAQGRLRVEVVGMNGNVAEIKTANAVSAITVVPFNLTSKSQGMYMLRVTDSKGKVITTTVLIQR